MGTLVCNKSTYKRSGFAFVDPEEEDMFVPDQAMTISEIMERARRGLLSDVRTLHELPDDVEEYYDDLTSALDPEQDDVSDLE